jgi:HEPN domain-containing protein
MLIITRADFKKLAKSRLREAGILLERRQYSGAYYLCGYVVECGLKACIAKAMKRFQYPDLEFVRSCYTHNLKDLLRTAGLQPELQRQCAADRQFDVNWGIVSNWSEQSRYATKSGPDARAIFDAVSDRAHGVLQWIERHW